VAVVLALLKHYVKGETKSKKKHTGKFRWESPSTIRL